jgi:hypothetical protein
VATGLATGLATGCCCGPAFAPRFQLTGFNGVAEVLATGAVPGAAGVFATGEVAGAFVGAVPDELDAGAGEGFTGTEVFPVGGAAGTRIFVPH